MNNNELKPAVKEKDNFGIAFKIRKSCRKYSISCHIIDRGEYMQRCCVSNIEDKGFARYMLEVLKGQWNIYNKILRFTNQKSVELTPFCELLTIEDLEKFEKKYQKMKKLELELSKKRELNKLEKEFEDLSQKMKILQEKIEELNKR